MPARGSTTRGARGTVALETALVLPLVILVVLGIIQYGYHYWALETASATAREAARRLVVGTDEACTVAAAQAHAEGPNTGDVPAEVAIEYVTASGDPERGALVTVTVSFRSLDIGLLPLPDGGEVSQTATNRVENVPAEPLPCLDP